MCFSKWPIFPYSVKDLWTTSLSHRKFTFWTLQSCSTQALCYLLLLLSFDTLYLKTKDLEQNLENFVLFFKKKKKKTRTGFLGPVIVFVLPLLIRFFFSLFYSDEWVNIWEFSQVFKICIFILVVLFYNCASHHFLICSS